MHRGGPRGVIHSNSWDQGKLQKAKGVRSWPLRMSRMSADGEGGNRKSSVMGLLGVDYSELGKECSSSIPHTSQESCCQTMT